MPELQSQHSSFSISSVFGVSFVLESLLSVPWGYANSKEPTRWPEKGRWAWASVYSGHRCKVVTWLCYAHTPIVRSLPQRLCLLLLFLGLDIKVHHPKIYHTSAPFGKLLVGSGSLPFSEITQTAIPFQYSLFCLFYWFLFLPLLFLFLLIISTFLLKVETYIIDFKSFFSSNFML